MGAAALVSHGVNTRLRLACLGDLSPQDRVAWDEVGKQATGAGPFAQPWFVEQSLLHCDRAGEVRLAIVEDGLGGWIGTMPLAPVWRYGRVPFPHWENWRHPNMFTGAPLVLPGRETEFWEQLIAGLEGISSSRFALRLCDLPSDEPATQALLSQCGETGRPIKFDHIRSRAMLGADVAAEEDWQQKLKPDLRRRLSSLERKLVAEHGELEFSTCRDQAAAAALIEEFLRLEHSGWKGEAGSALLCDNGNEAFFRGTIAAAAAHGAVEFAALRAGGHMLAMSAHFIAGSGYCHGFKMAFNQAFGAFAPGVLLLGRMTGHFIAGRCLPFDSCSAPEQQPIGKFWPSRRELVDCGLALGGKAGWTAFRALAFCEELAHRHKAAGAASA